MCPITMDEKGQNGNISPLHASQNAQNKENQNQLNCNHSAWVFSNLPYLQFVIWTVSAISIPCPLLLADLLHVLKHMVITS